MDLPIGKKYSFNPSLWSTLAVLLLVPLFAGLGYWQLQRAAQKQDIIAKRAAAEQLPPQLIHGDEQAMRLHLKKVQVRCKLDTQRQLLLDNRVYRHLAGYEVLTVCRLNTRAVLINRGWVAPGDSREQLPEIRIDHQYASQAVSLDGYFAVPGKGLRLGQALNPGDKDWPRRVQYYDYRAIGDVLSLSLLPGVIYLEPSSPLVLNYNWKPIAFSPEKHYGYAFQWFALMIALLVLYTVLNCKKRENL